MGDLDKAAGVIARAAEVLYADEEKHGIIRINCRFVDLRTHTKADYLRKAQALHDAGLLLPDGFVAVPREPTEERIEAGRLEIGYVRDGAMVAPHAMREAYRAMIQAQETPG